MIRGASRYLAHECLFARSTSEDQIAFDATDDGEVTSSVKDSFYRDLCGTEVGQVVVFENTTPPEDVQAKCNYIHFSGSSIGRWGFIPPRIG